MVADGTFPARSAEVGRGHQPAGRGRADPAGRARPGRLRQPERAVRLPPDGLRQRPGRAAAGRATRELVSDPFDAAEVAARIDAALAGKQSLRMEVRGPRRGDAGARAAAAPARRRGRRAGAGPRRHRPAPAGHGAAEQGRHHPGDPPPGEEQPADGGRAAAAAGPAHGDPGGQPGARGERAPGELDRAGARDAVARRWPSGWTSTSWWTRCCRRSATGPPPSRGRRCAATAASAPCPRRWPPRWCWCSPSWCTTRWRTPSTPGRSGRSWWSPSGRPETLDVAVADDGHGLPEGFDLDDRRRAGPADRAHPAATRSSTRRCRSGPARAAGPRPLIRLSLRGR